MSRHKNIFVNTVLVTSVVAAAAALADTPAYVTDAVASVGRPAEDIARDNNRKPAETIAFAGVKPGDKVLELIPARGYYTRILSKVVGVQGKVYAFAPGRPPAGMRPGGPPMAGAPQPSLAAQKPVGPSTGMPMPNNPAAEPGPNFSPIDDVYRLAQSTEFKNVVPILAANMGAYGGYIGLPEQVDVVWTSDNYHDFHISGGLPVDVAALNKAIFRDLKPGGVYLIVDHAGAAGTGTSQTATLHRIDPEAVKQEVLAAGFVLDGESKALANSADDHSKGMREMNGQADELVLRFKKPKTANTNDRRDYKNMEIYYGNTFVMGDPQQRVGTIFYHKDGTYQEFRVGAITNGIWYLDVDGNNCMRHETDRAGNEATVACRPMMKFNKLGETIQQPADGRMDAVTLLPGYLYPSVAATERAPR